MKKTKQQDQAELLRKARKRLNMTNAELADALGVSESTMLAWLAPETSGKHRTMPELARRLLPTLKQKPKRK